MLTVRGSGFTKIELVVRATDESGNMSFATLEQGSVVWTPVIKNIEENVGVNREAKIMLEDLKKLNEKNIF